MDFSERYVTSFYTNLAKGRLVGQKCRDCGAFQVFPKVACRKCQSTNLETAEFSKRGRLILVNAAYRGSATRFNSILPCAFGVVELKEGPIIYCPVTAGIDYKNIQREIQRLPLEVSISTRQVGGNFIPIAKVVRRRKD